MQQPVHKVPAESHHYNVQEEKIVNDNITNFIDPDYVLNYLNNNDLDNLQKNCIAHPTFYPAIHHDLNFQLSGLNQFQHRNHQQTIAGIPNIFEKTIPKDQWILHNYNEGQKYLTMPNNAHVVLNLNPMKLELNPDQNNVRLKKIKRNESEKKLNEIVNTTNLNQKMNIKNTYINKINTLISDPKLLENESAEKKIDDRASSDEHDSLLKQEITKEIFNDNKYGFGFKKVKSCDVLKSYDIEKINDKLARNRESARNSRKRKKIYIELLERKVDQLTKELESTKKQLEILNTDNQSNNNLSMKAKLLNTTNASQLFERLEKMLSTSSDDIELNLLLDSIRLRLGANSKERIDIINSDFKQIIDLIIPIHMKYLLWAASEGKDAFNTQSNLNLNLNSLSPKIEQEIDQNNGYWNEILLHMGLTDHQKNGINKYRRKITMEKQRFMSLIGDLNSTRKAIVRQANTLQNIIDDFRNILSPAQVGKFLVFLEKAKNRKEFNPEKFFQLKAINKLRNGNLSDSDSFLNEIEKPFQLEDTKHLDKNTN